MRGWAKACDLQKLARHYVADTNNANEPGATRSGEIT